MRARRLLLAVLLTGATACAGPGGAAPTPTGTPTTPADGIVAAVWNSGTGFQKGLPRGLPSTVLFADGTVVATGFGPADEIAHTATVLDAQRLDDVLAALRESGVRDLSGSQGDADACAITDQAVTVLRVDDGFGATEVSGYAVGAEACDFPEPFLAALAVVGIAGQAARAGEPWEPDAGHELPELGG